MRNDLQLVLNTPITQMMLTDWEQVVEVITETSHTTAKRLIVEEIARREVYKPFEI